MKEVASRHSNLPAPTPVVVDDLCDPSRQPVRPWLVLHDDEIAPTVIDSNRPTFVVWSSLWITRPDASVRFELTPRRGGTDLRWSLYVNDPVPQVNSVKHMRHRIGELVNANLRYTYGQ